MRIGSLRRIKSSRRSLGSQRVPKVRNGIRAVFIRKWTTIDAKDFYA